MRLLFKTIPILFIVLGLLFRPCGVQADSGHDVLLKKAHELQQQYKEIEALAVYEKVLADDAENLEALSQASLLHSRMGERYADDSRKLEHFNSARTYAMRAYQLDALDSRSNYAMALSLACLAMTSGPKQRLSMTNQIKTYLDAALAADCTHADAWHLLGRWYYKIANLNFAEIAASKVMFGGIHAKATNQDAIRALEQAILYNPYNIRYYYDLASIYQEMKDKQATTTVLERALALNLELHTKDELELSRRCKVMLQEYQQ